MKIALIGYGKMGKQIEEIAKSFGHEIVLRITSSNKSDFIPEYLSKADVAIEFTRPEAAYENIIKCFDSNVPVVTGTTGWYNRLDDIKKYCTIKNGSLLYASNFSIGVNIFFEINKRLSQLMSAHNHYKIKITEEHHTQKLDKPSGTAITLAEGIIDFNKNFNQWSLFEDKENVIPIESIRKDDVVGTHVISYTSDEDDLTISHKAFNRAGFAKGAVIAAEWLQNKKGVFTMSDVLK
ncbi:MAG TPA: 4-hydroxy-tetrahydrodipicolinate reductase [Bacteroidia bacterium]|nr:4-hydroxy-tetrahydrodipicolinate reductase [Bacteroidia bacterium]HNU34747.1 4-hydroxy-tetrahydrodipicolinate reductase [Bacteroidia bacterium]